MSAAVRFLLLGNRRRKPRRQPPPRAELLSQRRLLQILAGLLIISAGASLALGDVPLDWAQVWRSLMPASEPNRHALIFWELRVPRTALAIMAGAMLGCIGALMQGWTRNPLAAPGLLGTSACASLGGALAIHTGAYATSALLLPLAGLAGAGAGALVILFFILRRLSLLSLILAGIALQSFAAALTALSLNLAPDPHSALEIAFWLLGSVSERTQTEILLVLPFCAAGAVLALSQRRALDGLALGEETALGLGLNLRRLQWQSLLAASLAIGPLMALTGAIGFVGLVVPHALRLFVGARPGALLASSLLGGAVFLLWADMLVRVLPTHAELKLGVVTGLIGGPAFVWLLWRWRARLGGEHA